MPEQIFVGREKYITTFQEMLKLTSTKRVWNLYGKGGMGKTKILEQVIELCKARKNIPHVMIDFYDADLRSRRSHLQATIAATLSNNGNGVFSQYLAFAEDNNPRNAGYSHKLKNVFIDALVDWNRELGEAKTKGVLIFDTFERVKDNLVGSRLIEDWLPLLKNVVVIIAGRQQKNEIEFTIDNNLVEDEPIEPFIYNDAVNYLKERKPTPQIWNTIKDAGIDDCLFEFSDLIPLRLALSADWLVANVGAGEFLENLLGGKKEDFEKELVVGLHHVIDHPEKQFLPYMAHIMRPFDVGLIDELDIKDLMGKPSHQILEELSKFSFIKMRQEGDRVFYWFQDELRTLCHKYYPQDKGINWEYIQGDASRKMLKFYKYRMSTSTTERDKQIYLARSLYDEIFLTSNTGEGFEKFHKLFTQARNDRQIGYTSMLLESVKPLEELNILSDDQKWYLEVQETRWLNDIGNSKLAHKRQLGLLDKYANHSQIHSLYNALGASSRKLGRLSEALNYFEKSLMQSPPNNYLAMCYFIIGNVQIDMGNYTLAQESFNKASSFAGEYNTNNLGLLSDCYIQSGYVLGLLGQYNEAISFCDIAIDIANTEGKPIQIARVKLKRGDVYMRVGEYDKSLSDIKEAMYTCKEEDNRELLAESCFRLGFTQWFQSEEKGDMELLKEAKSSFELSIEVAREYNLEILPRALNQISNVYWDLGEKQEARKANQEAYQLASLNQDSYYIIDSLVGFAEFDDAEGIYQKIPEYVQQLHKYADQLHDQFEVKGYTFPLFFGRMRRILANSAFHQNDFTRAIDLYSEGLYMIAQHGGYGKYRLQVELHTLGLNINSLPKNEALNFYRQLKSKWSNMKNDRYVNQLLQWVSRKIVDITIEKL